MATPQQIAEFDAVGKLTIAHAELSASDVNDPDHQKCVDYYEEAIGELIQTFHQNGRPV